ncbi:MAG: Rab family GTPase [Candidatus Heimdallarchaeota archaeon]
MIPDNTDSSKDTKAVKIILIGDGGVGKTSLVQQFVHRKFSRIYKTTIGVDITPLNTIITRTQKPIRFVLWDMSGQTHFKRFRSRFYSGTSGALIVYDLTSANSYRNVQSWVKECRDNCHKKVPMVIVGNKADLEDLQIKQTRHPMSEEPEIPLLKTSAKENSGVDTAFLNLFTKIIGAPVSKALDHDSASLTTHIPYE